MQTTLLWIGALVGIVTALGVVGAGIIAVVKGLWYLATFVAEQKQTNVLTTKTNAEMATGNAKMAEVKDSICELKTEVTTELRAVRTELATHGQTLDEVRTQVNEHGFKLKQHGQAIGVLAALNGKDPTELISPPPTDPLSG